MLLYMSITLGGVEWVITVMGIAFNAVNVAVFVKQGFSDPVNISLLALTVSDLCSLVVILWSSLCYVQAFRDSAEIPLVADEVQLITGGWPHVTFTKVTAWITVFIGFERCLCVLRPLKVKSIITPNVTLFAMIAINFVALGCASFAYISLRVDWAFYPQRNMTVLRAVSNIPDSRTRESLDVVSYAINGVAIPIPSFFLVVACTGVLVIELRKKSSWRISNASADPTPMKSKLKAGGSKMTAVTTRDQRVVKMVILISGLFIGCYLPSTVVFLAATIEPELSYGGAYRNLYRISFATAFMAEAINASTNIFVYYKMSTKFRLTLNTLIIRKLKI
ncbi:unnamed protein product [Lymnaea stagnalis]|uniref:G-protein coupled receptors family 1 profile domain-containing protein n=1 Tax=Lymnaea stagnalis TaxID=6523 RepID=A0AAV2HG15_LYMST